MRVGYAGVPGDGLVQLKALGITPEWIEGYQRIGYRNLPVSTLVQLKALNITPEFVRATVGQQPNMPSVGELVQMKMYRTEALSDRHPSSVGAIPAAHWSKRWPIDRPPVARQPNVE